MSCFFSNACRPLSLALIAVLLGTVGCKEPSREIKPEKESKKEQAKTPSKEEEKGKPMSYGKAKEFLAKHTNVVELSDGDARVAVTPAWQGRVMTSACGGSDGLSFGFVNTDFIEAGKQNLQFNNYGAEERIWLSPEGGQFSLWFKPKEKQELKNWHTPPALNEGEWKAGKTTNTSVAMSGKLKFMNTSATPFEVDVDRVVKLLSPADFGKLFGEEAAKLAAKPGVKMVAYETDNTITNRGDDFSKDKGLVSIWILGMMNSSPKSVVLVPYKAGDETKLGPVVKSDYFGAVPAERLKVTPDAVLFAADAKFRSKIGTSQKRAKNVLGSIDFDNNVLTLVNFTMPEDPTKENYINNAWVVPQPEPFVGDVANAYNDGPNDLGSQLGAFYEIESLSPAKVLKKGESLNHCHRTVHIQADLDTLKKIAKAALGVDLDNVKKEMVK